MLLFGLGGVIAPGEVRAEEEDSEYQRTGVEAYLPFFVDRLKARLTHPPPWTSGQYSNFNLWKEIARAKVRESLLLPPPPIPFDPVVIAEEDSTPASLKASSTLAPASGLGSWIRIQSLGGRRLLAV